MITVEQALEKAAKELYSVSDRAKLEAEMLLCHHLGINRVQLVLKQHQLFDSRAYFALIAKRATNYPLEYITQEVSFYDTTLLVSEGVLIARPETEILVDKAIALIKKHNITKIAEIGIGSGAISISIAQKCKNVQIVATDINPKAIEVAQTNIDTHGLKGKITLLQTSLLDGIDEEFELIVSNPPYIAQDFVLPKNVVYEPSNALFGGKRGDELLRQIVLLQKHKQVPFLACEMGYDQKSALMQFFDALQIQKYRFYQDYAQLDRGFIIGDDDDR
ncbi:MAG: peptide chain release factor N(5)-glutamine methyltransferase [Campylobacterota bacterium]